MNFKMGDEVMMKDMDNKGISGVVTDVLSPTCIYVDWGYGPRKVLLDCVRTLCKR